MSDGVNAVVMVLTQFAGFALVLIDCAPAGQNITAFYKLFC
jgi:hypothetical protein